MSQKHLVIIFGPTAAGKTDFALQLASHICGEIINADVGQFYVPLSIGTAKPNWQKNTIPHHLFDILNTPRDLTVTQYRSLLIPLLQEVWDRGNVPIIVGGSGFYIASIFFPPHIETEVTPKIIFEFEDKPPEVLWQKLKEIDPKRAQEIHPHDEYRIKRALDIWHTTGIKPSEYQPLYQPLAPYWFVFLTRNRDQLYQRIGERVRIMMDEGWLQEVETLRGTAWEPFLKGKKLIGYDDIFTYLEEPQDQKNYSALVELIAKKTRNYAKRQSTFLRMLQKKLERYSKENEGQLT